MKSHNTEPITPSPRRQILLRNRLARHLGAAAVPAAIALITTTAVAIELIAGFASPESVAALAASGVVNTIVALLILKQQRTSGVLSEITLAYIATGNRGLLDELLGRLITGRFRRQDFQPADQLFRVLNDLIDDSDYELKRRLVEALPGLAEIDSDQTIVLMHRLREDWDAEKWRGDLRRRTVEALYATRSPRGRPLLERVSDDELIDLLRIRDTDEIWTVFAVLEASQQLAAVQRGAGDFEKADQTTLAIDEGIARLDPTAEEREALENHNQAYIQLVGGDLAGCLAKIDDSLSGSPLQRVSAARLIGAVALDRAASAHSKKILEIMARLSTDSERNARRPIARQESVRFILAQTKGANADIAKKLLLDLLEDDDDIIPITTFDLVSADNLADDLFAQAISVVSKRRGPPALMERVGRAEIELSESLSS